MIRVGIIGCSGYTALEAIRILLKHPQAQISLVTSRQADGKTICDMHPELTGRLELVVEDIPPEEIPDRCDVAFCCLPHAASAAIASRILDAGGRVVDLSADYRLGTRELYEKHYETQHPDPARIGNTPYGLPELFAEQIANSELVANPGCYPTSAILPLAPLLSEGLLQPETIIVDAKSGLTGAGRTPKLVNLYPEANESFTAYSVGQHRHQPEIVDILQRYLGTSNPTSSTGESLNVAFTPHLVPMDRGILSTIYTRPTDGVTANQLRECLCTFYESHQFVRIVSHIPATKHVAHSNFCDITVRENGQWIVLVSVIDNLVKGASGAAVQCMNTMFGLEQSLGLLP